MSTSTVCAYCRKPLLDREHALTHGPTCEQNPTRRVVRRATLIEVAMLADNAPVLTADAARTMRAFADALRSLAERETP